jgi:hypothetical protein
VNKHIVAALIVLGSAAHVAEASEVTVNITDLGWFSNNGAHQSYNVNTLTGSLLPWDEYRSFFLWTLPQLNGVVTAARIDFSMPYSLGASGSTSQAGEIYDIASTNLPYLRLDNGGGHGIDVFNDLGSGASYGTIDVPSSLYNWDYTLSVSLNGNAISAINSAAGAQFGLGMRKPGGGDFVLSSLSQPGSQRLVLTVSAVPEPSQTLLLMTGLFAMLGLVWRRHKQ